MVKELSSELEKFKLKLAKIPREMPDHWKGRNGHNPTATGIDHCSPGCAVCGGTGYYRIDANLKADGFGEVKICPNVNRFDLPYSQRFGLPREEAESLSWGAIRRVGKAIGLKEAIEAVQYTLKRGYGWVFIHGDFGIGKTLILKIATAIALKNGDAAYVRMAEILDHLRAAFDEKSTESESSRLEWWAGLPVLCIDEFDKVRSTPYGKERSFVLMDRRYEQAIREQSITIVSSNQPAISFDGYLCDRILDGRFYVREIKGESARPGMRYE